jgi:hypothetical protein
MPLNANALTSVANAKIWLRRQNVSGMAATDDTNVITLLINGVSNAIAKHCERQFIPETAATHTFKYTGDGLINIAPYEIRAITTLTIGGITLVAGTGIGDGDYIPQPRDQSAEDTYLWIDTRAYVYKYPRNGYLLAPLLNQRDVVIVGNFGMAAVPADVEMAALIAVADMYRNPEQAATRGSGDFQISEIQEGGGDPLPSESVKLLAPYVRPKVA